MSPGGVQLDVIKVYSSGLLTEERRRLPALNIKEDDKGLTIELRVPVMKKEDIKLDDEDGILTLSDEKNEEKEEENKYVRRKLGSYSFYRSIELPEVGIMWQKPKRLTRTKYLR